MDRLKEYYHRWCEAEGCTVHTHTSYAGRHFFCREHQVVNAATTAVDHAHITHAPRGTTMTLPIAVLVKE